MLQRKRPAAHLTAGSVQTYRELVTATGRGRSATSCSLIAVLSALLLLAFIEVSGVNVNGRASLPAMIDGTAHRPFVYRVLVPHGADLVASSLPEGLRHALDSAIASSAWGKRVLGAFYIQSASPLTAVLVLLLMYASLVGYGLAFETLFTRLFTLGSRRTLATALALLSLGGFFRFGYVYDFSTAFFSLQLVTLLALRRWGWFHLVFAVSCLNKETTILFSLPYLLCALPSLPRRQALGMLAIQAATFAAIRAFLLHRYGSNLGAPVEPHLVFHWQTYTRYSISGLGSVIALAAGTYLVVRRWAEKPMLLKRCLWILPPLAALYLLFGMPFEWRVFYEAHGVLVLLALHGVVGRFREMSPNSEVPSVNTAQFA